MPISLKTYFSLNQKRFLNVLAVLSLTPNVHYLVIMYAHSPALSPVSGTNNVGLLVNRCIAAVRPRGD